MAAKTIGERAEQDKLDLSAMLISFTATQYIPSLQCVINATTLKVLIYLCVNEHAKNAHQLYVTTLTIVLTVTF